MSSRAIIRPPWLQSPADVEAILETHEPSFEITLSVLRTSRDECPIVGHVLHMLLQQAGKQNTSEWELTFAKSHLAVDVQEILVRWAEEGLAKTMEGSVIGSMANNRKRRLVDLRTGSSLPMKRGSPDSEEDDEDDEEPDPKQMRMNSDKDFRCPYYVRNRHDSAHKECRSKIFPNPRKLKEHIWRFTKPFKCPTCGEGFGREKTKAIHCEQRKVKCTHNITNQYEGSYEYQRDRDIEGARCTTEILEIFNKYDEQKRGLASGNAEMAYGNGGAAAVSSMGPVPQSPHDGQQTTGWVSPETPTNPWAQNTQLHVQTSYHPSTPAHTPPTHQYNQNTLQSPHSPVHPNFNAQYPQPQSPMSFNRQTRRSMHVPRIIINDNNTIPMDEVMSAASATSYHSHSQPASPMMQNFSGQHSGGSMYQEHQQGSQSEQTSPDVQTVFSNGYGAWGPFAVRMRHSQ